MSDYADGGAISGRQYPVWIAPCDLDHVSPYGTCIRNPDGGHEWIFPASTIEKLMNKEPSA